MTEKNEFQRAGAGGTAFTALVVQQRPSFPNENPAGISKPKSIKKTSHWRKLKLKSKTEGEIKLNMLTNVVTAAVRLSRCETRRLPVLAKCLRGTGQ